MAILKGILKIGALSRRTVCQFAALANGASTTSACPWRSGSAPRNGDILKTMTLALRIGVGFTPKERGGWRQNAGCGAIYALFPEWAEALTASDLLGFEPAWIGPVKSLKIVLARGAVASYLGPPFTGIVAARM
jgi:hypothetical protein